MIEGAQVIRVLRDKMHGPLSVSVLTEKNAVVKEKGAQAAAKRAVFVLTHYGVFAPFLSPINRTEDGPLPRKLRHRATTVMASDPVIIDSQPPCVVGGKMREYQIDGLKWLVSQHQQGACSILGDEMGLGKTLQLVSFIG